MSEQRIILVDDKGCVHKLKTVDELNVWIRSENTARDTLFLPPLNCKNLQVFVGEQRCLEAIPTTASIQYRLTGTGCDCGNHSKEAGEPYIDSFENAWNEIQGGTVIDDPSRPEHRLVKYHAEIMWNAARGVR